VIGDGNGNGGRFRIVVRDDGPGLGPEQRRQALDRFTRFDPARAREDGGTGLGLAIVAELVHLHHGTLALDDDHPGLRVTLDLPVVPPTHAAGAASTTAS
jgi:signal transduction histidine kinase